MGLKGFVALVFFVMLFIAAVTKLLELFTAYAEWACEDAKRRYGRNDTY